MLRIRSRLSLLAGPILVGGVLGTATPAGAVGFGCITNTNVGNCNAGASQLFVDVTNPGGGLVDFTFRNLGPLASSITDVYWDADNSALISIFSVINTPGLVEFSVGANPPELPGAMNVTPTFATSAGFSADSDSPVQPKGVNPGESLTVRYILGGGRTYANALQDLTDGDLRIGIHVQGFSSGGSESFINVPVAIPEPGTGTLLDGGLLALVAARRRSLSI